MFYRLVTTIVAAVLSGMLTAAHAEESVTLRLKWFHQAQFAGFYVAKEKDLYKSAGLNVDIQPGGPDFPIGPQVVCYAVYLSEPQHYSLTG
jgi:NitT/TauT family transport system substrate-binding protein